jgi:hypothetical protein
MGKQLTHEQFVERAQEKHNNKYTYPDLYIKGYIKINIKCPIHGLWLQRPYSHLHGFGCPKCANEYTSLFFIKDKQKFIDEANIKHNFKYKYLDEYQGSHKKIKITCQSHGDFLQTPDKHLNGGNGCPHCFGNVKKTTQQFINEANIVHNYRYTYPGQYINARTNIDIKCIIHGIFQQVPDVHLNGCGCPSCAIKNVSKPETKWLDYLGVPNNNNYRQLRIKIGHSYIKPDAFNPITNTIYEFYGDFWHGNLKVLNPKDINKTNKISYGKLYLKTMERERLIKEHGYNLVTIWETDWNKFCKENKL